MGRSAVSFYSSVFLVSALLMALQILQVRILSVTTWYHVSFLVISIAMFGMTLGAISVYRGNEKEQRAGYAEIMASAAFHFGVFIVLALLVQILVPIVSETLKVTLVMLPFVAIPLAIPYYWAGVVLSMALTRTPYPVGKTYGIDLLGASCGCILALVLMKSVDAPSGSLILAALAFLSVSFLSGCRKTVKKSLLVALGLSLFAGWNASVDQPMVYPLWTKGKIALHNNFVHDEWNSISRVTVRNEETNVRPYLWGASAKLPRDAKASFMRLRIDGDAETPLTRFDGKSWDQLSYLEYDVTTLAYALPDIQSSAIIGVGGGRDLLTARYFGIEEITAMDINNVQISLLTEKEPFKSYTGNPGSLAGVHIINSEARSWFVRNKKKFDLIQMSLIDTWAATGAGAFALSENGLYTVDAWKIFVADLNPGGVFTVSRWFFPHTSSETERLLSLAMATLFETGAENPADHIFIATADNLLTLVMARDPLSPDQIEVLLRQAEEKGFNPLIVPGLVPKRAAFEQILSRTSYTDLLDYTRKHKFDITPPTDHRPFFFNNVRLTDPLLMVQLLSQNISSAVIGHARANMNLYVILLFNFIMVSLVFLYPLRDVLQGTSRNFVVHGSLWFLCIGFGFMFYEIALLQRMSIFLGHPVYSLSVVLFSLIFFTGLGSLMSHKYPLESKRKRILWVMLTTVIALMTPFWIDRIFVMYDEAELLIRAVVSIVLVLPAGLLFGYGFPTGMAIVERYDTRPTAWFWGLNGAAGVMGSALAIALNISMGLNWTMIIGALCYGLLFIPVLSMDPEASKSTKGRK